MGSNNISTVTGAIMAMVLLIGCIRSKDDSFAEKRISVSPDKTVSIYQYTRKEDSNYHISLFADFGSGGAGIFDVELDTVGMCNVEWISGNSMKVTFPSEAVVLRQEEQSYFLGKTIHIVYEREAKR